MNIKQLTAGVVGTALVLGAAACDNDKLTRVNDNPNSPTDAPSTALFTSASRNAVSTWLGNFDLRGFELLAQHLAEVQYPETDQYRRLVRANTSATFNGSYNVELQDLQLVLSRGQAANNAAQYGPAMVLRAWIFFNLTDTFGDIPYSQAFRADSGVLNPKYDEQKAIYTDLLAQLAKASTDMGAATGTGLGASDPIYAGNLARWRRFANSLRARHALRLVNVDPATASTQLQAAFSAAGGLITANADNAKFTWPGDGVYDNPWAANFQTRDDHRVSDRLMGLLRTWQDPRVNVYAMRAERDTVELAGKTLKYCPAGVNPPCYVGLANALTHANASPLIPYTSRPGAVFYPGATSYGTFGGGGRAFPSFIMTAAEVAFIQAEAAERGLGGLSAGQARGFYESGIRLSMEQWGVTDAAAITALLARPGVAYVGGVEGQKQIARQKWVALYTDGIQAWSEWRRTCQPSTVKPGPAATQANVPRRLQYSNTEQGVNAAQLDSANRRQGPDVFATRIYWDKSPTAAPTVEAGCGAR